MTAPTDASETASEGWPHPLEQVGYVVAGRYRLEEYLASGAMGGIWRGRHIELKSPVAIKFLDLAVTRETEMHGRFLQEARSTAAVRCAHVVQVFDYGKDENTPPFIVMELLEGETLERRLARGVLTALELDKIFREVACGISRAHAMGVVHRDLKPSNIFIAREGLQEVTKLIDFGIAKVDEQRLGFTPRAPTRAGTVIGTPEYMSPEQLRAGAEVDCSVDLWALAVVAFECLTGKLPFSGKSLTDLAVQICTEKPLTPSALACVPAGFDRWFAKATHRDSASRFASAEDMAAALSAVLQSAKAASPQQPGGAAAALRHAALWLSPRRAVVLGLALASAASIFVFRPAPPPHLPAASLAPQPGAAQQQPAPAETAREPAATALTNPAATLDSALQQRAEAPVRSAPPSAPASSAPASSAPSLAAPASSALSLAAPPKPRPQALPTARALASGSGDEHAKPVSRTGLAVPASGQRRRTEPRGPARAEANLELPSRDAESLFAERL